VSCISLFFREICSFSERYVFFREISLFFKKKRDMQLTRERELHFSPFLSLLLFSLFRSLSSLFFLSLPFLCPNPSFFPSLSLSCLSSHSLARARALSLPHTHGHTQTLSQTLSRSFFPLLALFLLLFPERLLGCCCRCVCVSL